jgi:RimJ/RimL family protein N-acetyltransferase
VKTAPVLYTGRLILRPHRIADLDASAAMWGNPEVTQHILATPSTRTQAWSRMLNYAGLWSMLGYGYWAIEERSSRTFVGDVGLADFHRAIDPPIDGNPEAGWVLSPQFWGKGYGTEAVRAALAWADASLVHDRTICLIAPENVVSIRVAKNARFVETGSATLNGEPTMLFVRAKR